MMAAPLLTIIGVVFLWETLGVVLGHNIFVLATGIVLVVLTMG